MRYIINNRFEGETMKEAATSMANYYAEDFDGYEPRVESVVFESVRSEQTFTRAGCFAMQKMVDTIFEDQMKNINHWAEVEREASDMFGRL